MMVRFLLSREKLFSDFDKLKNKGFRISYSYKTNRVVGDLLQEKDCDFSVHSFFELAKIRDKSRIWFFTQAQNKEEFERILSLGVRKFVIDNEEDFENVLEVIRKQKIKVWVSLRMKFKEYRIGSGKYFVYGLDSRKVRELVSVLKKEDYVEKIGVHVHRKTQNTSEWNILDDLKDSIGESLQGLDFVNFGGGLPVKYASYGLKDLDYIFNKLEQAKKYFEEEGIEVYVEPGRFLAAPCVKLETEIIQKQKGVLVLDTSLYRCALDTLLTGTKMIVEGELEEGEAFLLKGNSPTRDDIFRYRVRLSGPRVGDRIVFLNAGAYSYSTDFFGYKPLETVVVKRFEDNV